MQFIHDNFWLFLIAIMSGIMLLWSFVGNRLRGIREADSAAALQLINHKDAIVLDVREADEFKTGRLLNAKHIPLGKLRDRVGELERYRDKPIVVVCRSGNRSATACSLLGKEGFTQVYNLSGGIMAWQKAGLPVER
ncbi:MAG TPA: rhodanese-like domain-containing protein [Gallionellaceae bacterium]|nr:rhodanese-like domain-containing protein [Gallionellaceae bacterium]